jgi:hypothetical protein
MKLEYECGGEIWVLVYGIDDGVMYELNCDVGVRDDVKVEGELEIPALRSWGVVMLCGCW